MPPLPKLIAAAGLGLCLATTAIAGPGHRYDDRHDHHPRHHHHHRSSGSNWVGPAIAFAITGAALGAMATQAYATPTPTVVYTPPARSYAPPVQPADTWYYCASSNQYYPYTQACPEGWQAVYPR